MRFPPASVVSAVVLALAVVIFFVFGGGPLGPMDESADEAFSPEEPDTYGQDVTFSQLRPDGSMHYRLDADTIRQFEDEQATRLLSPELRLESPTSPPWDIAAAKGYLDKKPNPDGTMEDVVYLSDDVEMVQTHPTNGRTILRSETFYIYPDRQYAQTHEDVMIDTEVGRTRAAGLTADLDTGTLHLTSRPGLVDITGETRGKQRVHTIILPEQFKQRRTDA